MYDLTELHRTEAFLATSRSFAIPPNSSPEKASDQNFSAKARMDDMCFHDQTLAHHEADLRSIRRSIVNPHFKREREVAVSNQQVTRSSHLLHSDVELEWRAQNTANKKNFPLDLWRFRRFPVPKAPCPLEVIWSFPHRGPTCWKCAAPQV